jgi:hypothetical protein
MNEGDGGSVSAANISETDASYQGQSYKDEIGEVARKLHIPGTV